MEFVADYLKHGWGLIPIPPGRKGPVVRGWNTRGALLSRAEDLIAQFGVGLAHAYSGTMAIDIDQIDKTKEYGIDVDTLLAADDAVIIDSGRYNHGKLLYKMPFGLVLPSVQFCDEKNKAVFNLRCGTRGGKTVQDILPPTIHPETNEPYKWDGKGHWSRLPVCPESLLDIWIKMLKTETVMVSADGVDASWDEIQEALGHITPDCSRNEWITVGMALQSAGAKTYRVDEAFSIWDEWSLPSHKYPGEHEIQTQWRSFKPDGAITIGTLFHIARKYGWVRSTPDASTMFTNIVEITSPDQMLQNFRPIPPDINLSLWPEILRIRATEISDTVGCDPIVPLFAGLAAVCGVIDARMRLELMPGFQVPPVLWLMTIGDPADKKSPGSRPMLSPLKNIEVQDRIRYKNAVLQWEATEAAYSVAKKSFLNHAASPDALFGVPAPELPPIPDEPVAVKITVSDITSQKLMRLASDRPRGLLCYLDEMNGWVKKIVEKYSAEDRSTWVVGYESERHEMDRVGGGSIHADNFAVSIYGNIQPAVFKEHLAALSADGLLQRFIPGVLRHAKTRLGNPVPDYLTHKDAWEQTLRFIFSLNPMVYKLSDPAYQEYRKFQEWYEGTKYDERLIGSTDTFLTAFGKLEGLAGRLILLFHVIESPFNPVVDTAVVKRVVKLIKTYIIPAYRYALGEIGGADVYELWLSEYIIQHADLEKISLTEIRRSSRSRLGQATNWSAWQTILSAMDMLEGCHWVARADDRKEEFRGHAEWIINPQLRETFKEYRKKVIKIKQQQNELFATTWNRADHRTPAKPVAHGVDEIENPDE